MNRERCHLEASIESTCRTERCNDSVRLKYFLRLLTLIGTREQTSRVQSIYNALKRSFQRCYASVTVSRASILPGIYACHERGPLQWSDDTAACNLVKSARIDALANLNSHWYTCHPIDVLSFDRFFDTMHFSISTER